MKALPALLLLAAGLQAQTGPMPTAPPPAAAPAPSPWYVDRGTAPRAPGPVDPVPDVALQLALLLKDGHVPGFYDGQFASVAGRFDELAALASEPDANHVLRVMAVMALQEAGSGEKLAAVLDPLIISPHDEIQADSDDFLGGGRDASAELQRRVARADLSLHARFSLAKDGQSKRALEKIAELDNLVHRRLPEVLDPSIDSYDNPMIGWYRQIVFDIGYHYQQFDDYEHASEWFHLLTDKLPGHGETSWAHYDLACIAALQGRPEEAVAHLQSAFAVGFTDVHWMLQDGDLRSLRERPDFQALAERMRSGGLPATDDKPGSVRRRDVRPAAPTPAPPATKPLGGG
jgi:hypothetical protein